MHEVVVLLEDSKKIHIVVQSEDLDCLDEIINSELEYVINPVEVPNYENKYRRLKKELEDSTNDSIVEVLEGYWEETDRLQERIVYLENEIKKIILGGME